MNTGGHKAIAVIGEGITEKYYVESLRAFAGSNFQIVPKQLGIKASSLDELEKAVQNAVEEGYDEVYCLIDMDSKEKGASVQKYDKLKSKYHGKHIVKKKRDFLHKFVSDYEKHERYFRSVGNLHKKMLDCGGDLKKAIRNARKSLIELESTESSDASYSEMCNFFNALEIKE